jgi:hypothetical protein
VATVIGWSDRPEEAVAVADSLVDDGLAVVRRGRYRLR